ncbi:MAG: hypothetical protein CMF74_11220 [Maricaulis sp.]|jgi:hypothetical protein|nr:hypothetical protein [Maricaulis sp.]HAQ36731.1 hypothetical protein [Alphaproteobacteria bacterium]|tara:strand:- start:188 stop:790 length:603 start_codon:yes stop_codon:yes gene_type:complete
MDRDHPLEDVLNKAADAAEGEKVHISDLLDLYGDRSFGPILLLLGLLAVIPPMGAIPGVPAAVGAVIILFSVQMVFGRKHIWLPGFIADRSISKDKIRKAHDKTKGVLGFIDGLVTERLSWATGGPARYGAAVLATLLALALIPLELVPFAVAIPGVAISMIGLALVARDGALMLVAYALSAIAGFVIVKYSPLAGMVGL